MAITTTLAANAPGTTYPGTVVACLLTVTNGGSTAVNVTSISVTAGGALSGAVVSLPALGQGQTRAVAGSNGTLAIPFSITPTSPTANDGVGAESGASRSYALASITYTDDAQAVADSSSASFTVTAPVYTAGG